MAKRNLFWHLGPEDLGSVVLPEALGALDADDVHTISAAAARDADLDLRRAHASAGLHRKDVEGAWARLESKVWHTRGTWLVSTPAVHLADEDQRRLAVDGLRGVKVHYVVLRTPDNGEVAAEIVRRWTQPLHPERVHLVDTDGSIGGAWEALLTTAGLAERPLPEGIEVPSVATSAAAVLERGIKSLPGRPDVHARTAGLLAGSNEAGELDIATRALTRAAARLAEAERRVEELEAENGRLDRKRRKHKRRLKALQAEVHDGPDAA